MCHEQQIIWNVPSFLLQYACTSCCCGVLVPGVAGALCQVPCTWHGAIGQKPLRMQRSVSLAASSITEMLSIDTGANAVQLDTCLLAEVGRR